MKFTLPSLPWQVTHSLGVAAVITTLEIRNRLDSAAGAWRAHPKNNAVRCLTPSTYRTRKVFPFRPAPKVRKIRFQYGATPTSKLALPMRQCRTVRGTSESRQNV
jgi:hypothetical protein